MAYKSNNATMGEICAKLNNYEKNKKPLSSDKNLINQLNEIESQKQHYAKPARQNHDEGQGPV